MPSKYPTMPILQKEENIWKAIPTNLPWKGKIGSILQPTLDVTLMTKTFLVENEQLSITGNGAFTTKVVPSDEIHEITLFSARLRS